MVQGGGTERERARNERAQRRDIVLSLSSGVAVCIDAASEAAWHVLSPLLQVAVASREEGVSSPHAAMSILAAMFPEVGGSTARVAPGALLMAMSARAEDEVAALRAGADVFVCAPLDWRLLDARLCSFMRRRQPPPPGGALRLDEGERVLHAGGVSARLSEREYEILLVLYERRERWVPRPVLFSMLKIGASGLDSSLLRTHVLNIRGKLGEWRWVLRSDRRRGLMLTERRDDAVKPSVD